MERGKAGWPLSTCDTINSDVMQRRMLHPPEFQWKSPAKVILQHADLSITQCYLGKVNGTEAIRWDRDP